MEAAMFELALSTMLRSGDLLSLRAKHVIDAYGRVVREFPVKMEKTSEFVQCFVSDKARAAIEEWIRVIRESDVTEALDHERLLFPIDRRTYSRRIKGWAACCKLDPKHYSTHSMRRTAAAHIYRMTKNIEAIRLLLGHTSLAHTQAYLGVAKGDAFRLAEEHQL